MATDPNRPSISAFQAQAEIELLHLILQDEAPYPWNPTDPEAESYFVRLEQELDAIDWFAEEVTRQSQTFSTQLNQLWAEVAPSPQADLLQRLTAQVPSDLVDRILNRARQVVVSNLSLADQLVSCVQELLPNWGEDDLHVFARPYAYAMRDAEDRMQSLGSTQWSDLSDIEQVRLSLAIARLALEEATSAPTSDAE